MSKAKIAVFVSGRGSNAQALIDRQKELSYEVKLMLVSKVDALAITIAKNHQIPYIVLNKKEFSEEDTLLSSLKSHQIDFLCLAGFLWKIPRYLIAAYPNRIVNIHPSLLPKFGGKGMYGKYVHQAVIDAKEEFTGITIHLVNEKYDEGKILFQEKISVQNNESSESLSQRVLTLEHKYYPQVLDALCKAEK